MGSKQTRFYRRNYKKIRNIVKSVEYKVVESGSAPVNMTDNNNVFFPCAIPLGSKFNERIGKRVLIKSIIISGRIEGVVAGALGFQDLWNNYRMGIAVVPSGYETYNSLVLRDRIFTNTTIGNPHIWFRHLDETSKIKMIKDKRGTIYDTLVRDSTGTAVGMYNGQWQKNFRIKKKLNMAIEYEKDNQTGHHSSVLKNFLFFWFYSDSTTIPHPSITFSVRCRFIDL